MDVGTVLTLLAIILAIAGPVIEKKLKKAGKVDQAREFRNLMDTITRDKAEDAPEYESSQEAPARPISYLPETQDAYELPSFSDSTVSGQGVPQELLEGGYRSVRDIMAERHKKSSDDIPDAAEKKFSIDPKKLVVYSEIMKPKF